MSLTAKQAELLYFIIRKIDDTGVAPSYDEMKEAIGVASKSGIHRLITALEQRGHIRRDPKRWRAIRICSDLQGWSDDDLVNELSRRGWFDRAAKRAWSA